MEPTSSAEFWTKMRTLLEAIFTPEWLVSRKAQRHPARRDWEICRLLESQDGMIGYPSQRAILSTQGRILLDAHAWIGAMPESDGQALLLGDIRGYGDRRVTDKLIADVRDPRKYSDWLVELLIAGTHRLEEREVTPLEDDGLPDMRIGLTHGALFVECKRVYVATESRLRATIKKANKQIKLAVESCEQPYDGAVVLDLNGSRRARFGSSEWVPDDVEHAAAAVMRALSGDKNRCVRRAFLLWDDYRFHGDNLTRTLVAYSRRVRVVEHSSETRATDLGVDAFRGASFAALMMWTPK